MNETDYLHTIAHQAGQIVSLTRAIKTQQQALEQLAAQNRSLEEQISTLRSNVRMRGEDAEAAHPAAA